MFSKDVQAKLDAVTKHIQTLRNIGLTRLSTLLNHQASAIKLTEGNQLLYVQYCRVLNIELQKTRDEFNRLYKECGVTEEKKEDVQIKKEVARRLSDSEMPKVIDLENKQKPILALKREFNLAPLPATLNFVDNIKAPYEVPKTNAPTHPKP